MVLVATVFFSAQTLQTSECSVAAWQLQGFLVGTRRVEQTVQKSGSELSGKEKSSLSLGMNKSSLVGNTGEGLSPHQS